jgi:hypothetical protein
MGHEDYLFELNGNSLTLEQLLRLRKQNSDVVILNGGELTARKILVFESESTLKAQAADTSYADFVDSYFRVMSRLQAALEPFDITTLETEGSNKALVEKLMEHEAFKTEFLPGSTVYEHQRFEGDSMVVVSAIPHLGVWPMNWNDQITSIKSAGIVLCEHAAYTGARYLIGPAVNIGNLTPAGWNDRTTSLSPIP